MLIEAVLDVSLLTLMGAGVKSRIIFVFADPPSLTVLLLVVVDSVSDFLFALHKTSEVWTVVHSSLILSSRSSMSLRVMSSSP